MRQRVKIALIYEWDEEWEQTPAMLTEWAEQQAIPQLREILSAADYLCPEDITIEVTHE